MLGDLTGKTVLDAGCGNGYLTRKMAQTAKKVYGVDFTEKLIELAKQKNNPANVEFSVGNLEKLQFPDSAFDLVLCNMVLMDVENIEKAIAEMSRVLKKNGIIVASIIHPCFENPPFTYSLFEEKEGKKARLGRVVQNYFDTGLIIDKNQPVENGEPYQHYHYMISDYLNAFSKAGLSLEETNEPNEKQILNDEDPDLDINIHTPTFVIFKLRKTNLSLI